MLLDIKFLPGSVDVFKFFISFVLIVVLFGTFILFKYAIKRRRYSKIFPSIGTMFIDILGNLHTFSWNTESWNEYSATNYMLQFLTGYFYVFRKEQIFLGWIGYVPFIGVNKPEAVEEVLGGIKHNQKAWVYDWLHCWLGTGLLTSHGKKWKSRRKLLTPAFHFDILKDFLPVINEKSQLLIQIFEKETTKSYTNIVPLITLCSLDIICETTLGVNIKAQENRESDYVKAVLRVSDALMKRVLSFFSWFDFIFFLTTGRGIKKDLKLLHDFTISVIQDKKRKIANEKPGNEKPKRKALMDLLLEHNIETKDLTDEDIREEVDTFTFEGHDTTAMAMSWALYMIGLHKDVQDNIHEELDRIFGDDFERPINTEDLKDMKYLECVIKETLRLYPSVPFFARKADSSLNICGNPIPEGASFIILPYQLHRNEEVFPNAEKFDPTRFTPENSVNRHPYAYIPFSAGPRNCIGQRFAIMEEKVVLANILRNFTLQSLDPRDKVVACIEIILRPTNRIRIQIRPRHKRDQIKSLL